MRLTLDEMLVQYPSEMSELALDMRDLYGRAMTGSFDREEQPIPTSTQITSFFANRLGGQQPISDSDYLQVFEAYEADETVLKAQIRASWNDVWSSRGAHGYQYTYYFDQVYMGWCWRGS